MNFKEILGFKFIDEEVTTVANYIASLASESGDQQHYVVTLNPEIILKAWDNDDYMRVLSNASVCTADGFGIQWADWFTRYFRSFPVFIRRLIVFPTVLWFLFFRPTKNCIKRVTGVELMEKILIWHEGLPMFLLGAQSGVAEGVVRNYPYANVVGTYAGLADESCDEDTCEKVREAKPVLAFVAFGAPKQELWIDRNLTKLRKIKVMIGVGGSFDFLSGEIDRAPLLMQNLGLEWLVRLFRQPSRWRRIFNAVVIFPWRVACMNRPYVL